MKIPAEILSVAQALGDMREEVVFVGGMVRDILVTDPSVAGRPTADVDVILDVTSPVHRVQVNERLRALGFREDTSEDAPICRYVLKQAAKGLDLPVDFMPLDPGILGFSNVWYPDAFTFAKPLETAAGTIRVVDAPHFLATKLESYASRGKGDVYHHDLEDIVAIVDGREGLLEEVKETTPELREFIVSEFRLLLQSEAFISALPGHLAPDEASQLRLPALRSRFEEIASLDVSDAEGVAPGPEGTDKPWRVSDVQRLPLAGATRLSWSTPRSSNIEGFSYEPSTSVLRVTFHGGRVYEYPNVPSEVVSAWTQAASTGRYFHRWIKRYGGRRVKGEVESPDSTPTRGRRP